MVLQTSDLGSVPLHPRSSGRERLAVCNQLHCHYADPLFHGELVAFFVFGFIWGEWDGSHVCDVGRKPRVRVLLLGWLGLRGGGTGRASWPEEPC